MTNIEIEAGSVSVSLVNNLQVLTVLKLEDDLSLLAERAASPER